MNKQQKSITGGIPLDSLPLNWGKMGETKKILIILNKCFGPYGPNNKMFSVNTVEEFKEIYKIAKDQFDESIAQITKECKQSKAEVDQPTLSKEIPIQENYCQFNNTEF